MAGGARGPPSRPGGRGAARRPAGHSATATRSARPGGARVAGPARRDGRAEAKLGRRHRRLKAARPTPWRPRCALAGKPALLTAAFRPATPSRSSTATARSPVATPTSRASLWVPRESAGHALGHRARRRPGRARRRPRRRRRAPAPLGAAAAGAAGRRRRAHRRRRARRRAAADPRARGRAGRRRAARHGRRAERRAAHLDRRRARAALHGHGHRARPAHAAVHAARLARGARARRRRRALPRPRPGQGRAPRPPGRATCSPSAGWSTRATRSRFEEVDVGALARRAAEDAEPIGGGARLRAAGPRHGERARRAAATPTRCCAC